MACAPGGRGTTRTKRNSYEAQGRGVKRNARSDDHRRLPGQGGAGVRRQSRCDRRAGSARGAGGAVDVRTVGRAGAGLAGRAGRAGGGGGRAGGGGQPQLGPAAGAAVRGADERTDLCAGQLPSEGGGDRVRRTAEWRLGAAGRPRGPGDGRRRRGGPPVHAGGADGDGTDAFRCGATALVEPGRGRHRDDQLHVGNDRTTQGSSAHAPQHLGERADLRSAHTGMGAGRVPAHLADVPLQRLGYAVRDGRPRGQTGGAAQGRRGRDPAPGGRTRRDADVRRARGVERGARRGGGLGGPGTGA